MANSSAVKRKLSGSTDGKWIKVVATTTAWTLIHTAVAGTTAGVYDEIWLYAMNNDAAAIKLTIEFGSAWVEDNVVATIQPLSGMYLLVPWFVLQNEATVKAFAATANKITIHWWVNSITEA